MGSLPEGAYLSKTRWVQYGLAGSERGKQVGRGELVPSSPAVGPAWMVLNKPCFCGLWGWGQL